MRCSLYIHTFCLYILLLSVRVRCFNSSLIPIYGWPTERITGRDTYTRAKAVEQCRNLKLRLVNYSPYWTGCIKEFGRRTLQLTGLSHLFTWLETCQYGQCYYYQIESHREAFYRSPHIKHVSHSTFALCRTGKIHCLFIWIISDNADFYSGINTHLYSIALTFIHLFSK